MPKRFFPLISSLSIVILVIFSCKKEYSCENCKETVNGGNANKPPIADAKPDTSIFLPTDSVILNGNGSHDPDGTISSFQWTKIAGPSMFTITNATAKITSVKSLVAGIYQFELKVTDNLGLQGRDTARIEVKEPLTIPGACDNSNRSQVPAQLIPVGTLSQSRFGISVVAAGNKIFFAGGRTNSGSTIVPSARVDIYNITTNSWITAQLCCARYSIATATWGNLVLFAGGETANGNWPVDSVDIYNLATNTWTVAHLSKPGSNIAAAATNYKFFFAGGDPGATGTSRSTTIDIYNYNDNTWSTATLSEMKVRGHAAMNVEGRIYIIGGETLKSGPSGSYMAASNKMDVYQEGVSNPWSVDTMMEGKIDMAATYFNFKLHVVGGITGDINSYHKSCFAEAKNVFVASSNIWNTFKPASWNIDEGQNAVVRNNQLILFRASGLDKNKFDIWQLESMIYKIGVLPQPLPEGASIICVNNVIYITGGAINGDYSNLSNQVSILNF